MTAEEMERFLDPKSIAVIGASRDVNSVGHGILRSLVTGCVFDYGLCTPFPGKIFPVNPKADEILGIKCHSSVLAIPDDVDLAIISVPNKVVPAVLEECGQKKVKGAVVVSAGFAETGEEGRRLQEQIVEICRKHGMRLLGPNCLGFIRPPIGLNASFALTAPQPGYVAFISQSGALADSVIDWAIENRYNFSALVSLGNSADLDVSDFLEWCLADENTKSIAVYLEGISLGRRFMEVASRVSAVKPIVLLKGGKTSSGVKAAGSHTGSMVGNFRVWKAACKQSGVVLADTLAELFDMAKALGSQSRTSHNSVAVVTNGGGAGVLASDYCEEMGLKLTELSEATLKKLDASGVMHPAYSRRNPLDLIGDARPERYDAAVNTILDDPDVGGLIVIQTLQTMTDSLEDAKIVIEAKKRHPEKPVVCVFMGGKFSKQGIERLRAASIPDFNDPRPAVRVMAAMCGVI